MQPDKTSFGELEVTQKKVPERSESQNSIPEQNMGIAGELPQQGGASTTPPPVSAQHHSAAKTSLPSRPSRKPKDAKAQLKAQFLQLPAEDVDTIEKVWVEKADEIVEATKDDPHAQNSIQHELSRAYLKKRFNVDIE